MDFEQSARAQELQSRMWGFLNTRILLVRR